MFDVAGRGEREDFIKYHDWMFEKYMKNMEGRVGKNGWPASQFVVLADFQGFSFRNFTYRGKFFTYFLTENQLVFNSSV